MKKDYVGALKSLAITAFPVAVVMFASYCYQSYKAYQIMVLNPPRVTVAWRRITEGYMLLGNETPDQITPEFLRDRRQYVADIEAAGSPIPAATDIILQFPYVVEQVELTGNVPAKIEPTAPPIDILLGDPHTKVVGTKLKRNYVLSIRNMLPEGKLKLAVTLNINAPGRTICTGACDKPIPLPPPFPILGPMSEYINIKNTFACGEERGHVNLFAPFIVNRDRTISLDTFRQAPPDLLMSYEP